MRTTTHPKPRTRTSLASLLTPQCFPGAAIFFRSRYGVTPNLLIVPPQLLLYLALAPEEKISYKLGGPAAEARFEAGMAGYEARPFRSCGVVTSEPYEVSDDADAVQMLTRSTQAREKECPLFPHPRRSPVLAVHLPQTLTLAGWRALLHDAAKALVARQGWQRLAPQHVRHHAV